VPKYVASRTLTEPLAWNGSRLLADDLAAGVAAVKEQHDEVQVIGSLDLVQSLLRFGLVDRLNLWLDPVLLGSGKRVFSHGTVPAALHLTASETFGSGAVHLTYEPAGAPKYGNLGGTD
jgi:dihydrofolate reductase